MLNDPETGDDRAGGNARGRGGRGGTLALVPALGTLQFIRGFVVCPTRYYKKYLDGWLVVGIPERLHSNEKAGRARTNVSGDCRHWGAGIEAFNSSMNEQETV